MQPATLEALVHAHHASVFRAAWRVLRDEAAAEDVTQEVFLRVLDGRLDLDRAAEPAGVLAWAATRVALSRRRSDVARRRREETHGMGARRTDAEPSAALEREEEHRLVHAALAALPEGQQAALVLRFQEGLTYARVGRALGVSEPSAMARVARALEALGARLRALGGAGLAAALLAEDGRALGAVLACEAPAPPPGLAARVLAGCEGAPALAVPATAGVLALPGLAAAAVAAVALVLVLERAPTAEHAASAAAEPVRVAAVVSGAEDAADAAVPGGRTVRGGAAATLQEDSAAAPRPAAVHVVVRDADGAPVPAADVRAFVRAPGLKFPTESVAARTDGRGLATLALPVATLDERLRGEPWALLVDHPAAPRVHATVADLAPGEERELRFELTASAAAAAFELDVTVRDADGPVAGAEVALGHLAGDPDAGGELRVEADATLTGPDGRVTLRGRWLGAKRVVVDGRPVGRTREVAALEVDGPGVRTLEVTCATAWRLEGVATDVAGAPVVGAELTLYPARDGWRRPYAHPWWDEPPSAVTDAAGRFRLFADPPDEGGALYLGLPSWATGGWSPFALDVPGPTTALAPRLKREDDPRDVGEHLAELHGELVFPADRRSPWWPARWVEVVEVPDDVRAPAALADFVVAVLLGDEPDEGPRQQQAAQQLVAAPDLPIPLVPGDDGPQLEAPQQFDRGPASTEPEPHTFHRVGLAPGRHLLVARVRGLAPVALGPLELGPEEVRADVQVAPGPPTTREGLVLDAAGRPVEGALVTVVGPGPRGAARRARLEAWTRAHPHALDFGGPASARTDAAGRYVLDGLPDVPDLTVVAAHATRGTGTAEASGVVRLGGR